MGVGGRWVGVGGFVLVEGGLGLCDDGLVRLIVSLDLDGLGEMGWRKR